MFLIEFAEGRFINAEIIDQVEIKEGELRFFIPGMENPQSVSKEYTKLFLNNLQALNRGFSNVETRCISLNVQG